MARRRGELPEIRRAFAAGELAEDQVAVIVSHAPGRRPGDRASRTSEESRKSLRGLMWRAPLASDGAISSRGSGSWWHA